MMRIKAINDESDVEDEDGNQVTREAEVIEGEKSDAINITLITIIRRLTVRLQHFQETIAATEYVRALKFKKDDRADDALCLLTELLDTQVMFEVIELSAFCWLP